MDEWDYQRLLGEAQDDDREAQFQLGLLFFYGDDDDHIIEQSYPEALLWIRTSATNGYSEAQYFLGTIYSNGEGVEQSYVNAAKWYEIAANNGNADAQKSLGEAYYYGRGVEQSYSEADKWFKLAADNGCP